MKELDKIYNEDCLRGMADIPDGSIDCIIADPPYGVLNKSSDGGVWDKVIDPALLWEQYRRVTKPNAAIIIFAQGMFTADVMQSNRAEWRYNLIWDKINRPTGFLEANRKPLRIHEDMVVFYREQPVYHPQFTKGNPVHKRGNSGNASKTNGCYAKFANTPATITTDKYPVSIVSIEKEHNLVHWHPTQKPVDLIRWLVLTYTDPGDTVLDPFIGSGTTAVSCIREKRHFIGFELHRPYFDKAVARIGWERREPNLF